MSVPVPQNTPACVGCIIRRMANLGTAPDQTEVESQMGATRPRARDSQELRMMSEPTSECCERCTHHHQQVSLHADCLILSDDT